MPAPTTMNENAASGQPVPMSDAEYEEATRAHWSSREPNYEEVTISVRRQGKVVRFVLLTPSEAVSLGQTSCPESGPSA
jgi:hypothetical protein